MPRSKSRFSHGHTNNSNSTPIQGSVSSATKNRFDRLPSRVVTVLKYTALALGLTLGWMATHTYSLIKKAEKTTPAWREIYEELKRRSALSTHILDMSGEVIATVGGKNEDDVPIEEINPYLVAGLIAVEDQRFWHHNWFDTDAIRWMLRDNLCGILSGSGEKRWWSTISSQLFKERLPKNSGGISYCNAKLYQKIRERVQAKKLVDQWVDAKRFVLERYLNNTYFVWDKQWIAAAAKILFQKDQKDLTVDECALIVWLAKWPTYYNPFQYANRAEQRTDEVLRDLVKAYANWAYPDFFRNKYATFIVNRSEIQDAQRRMTTSAIPKHTTKRSTRINLIPHATNSYIAESQAYIYNLINSPDDIFAIQNLPTGSGYKGIITKNTDWSLDTLRVWVWWFEITTTIHADIQRVLIDGLEEHLAVLDKQWRYDEYPLEWAVICVDNKTGEVRWNVWWRNYRTSELDFASALTEQWSVVKAIVFATALEMWIIDSLEQVYVDTAITLHQRQYTGITDTLWRTPKNFWSYSGDTLNLGIAWLVHSRNTAPAFVFQEAARLGRWEEFLREIYKKMDTIGAWKYATSSALRQSPQTWLWLVQSDLRHIAATYMAITQWWYMPTVFTDIKKIETSWWWLLYAASTPQFSQLFTEEVCQELLPYLLQKWRAVSGWMQNVVAKSWTTWEWNKIRMVVVTPRFTLSIVVWPLVYSASDPVTKKNIIIGWWNRDATSLLSPLVRSYLLQLDELWYYDQDQRFAFQNLEDGNSEIIHDE